VTSFLPCARASTSRSRSAFCNLPVRLMADDGVTGKPASPAHGKAIARVSRLIERKQAVTSEVRAVFVFIILCLLSQENQNWSFSENCIERGPPT
jgi:hypothetical protein